MHLRAVYTQCQLPKGTEYVIELLPKMMKKCIMLIGIKIWRYLQAGTQQNYDLVRKINNEVALTKEAKKRRLFDKKKICIKNKKELSEGIMYESNCALFDWFEPSPRLLKISDNSEPIVVLFDLETGGFGKNDDILQIAAKHNSYEFSIYIKPTQKIDLQASLVNKLYFVNGHLEYNEKQVVSVSLQEALSSFYNFLCMFKKNVFQQHTTEKHSMVLEWY